MKRCMLTTIIVVFLTINSCAAEQTNQNNLITTRDPGDTSKAPIGPRLPSNRQITADDHPGHQLENHGQIRFEGQTSERPITFQDDPKDSDLIDIDKAVADSLLVDISFDNTDNTNRNDRILHTDTFDDASSENSDNKIKFEGDNDKPERSDESNIEDDAQNESSQVVFEGDEESEDDNSDYSDDPETETTDKPIKFENHDNESNSKKNTVTERVAFKEDINSDQEPIRKKKRKPRTNPRLQTTNDNPAHTSSNLLYPGYPGYPGPNYPGPGYPSPGDAITGYPGYPMPAYPTPGYPYPGYPTPYPGMPYPTPGYPGYSPYPTPLYPPPGPGYAAYPPPGYQSPENQRPPANPIAYPSSGPGDQSGYTSTRYPGQDYAGSPYPGASHMIPSGKPETAYRGPEYPYYQSYPEPGNAQAYPSDSNSQYPVQNPALYRPPGQPGAQQYVSSTPGGQYRPSRRPKSLTQRAVSAVAEALTSIALYDDHQCVPRLLCEVAGGSRISSPTLLKASASLQPLLSLLQAYNGAASSPLFIFGRAAVTGMTAKGNPSICLDAYPQCPKDPEKLINYLNNHNGGFFRFFGQPDLSQQPQNLEQFYNYLSGQYGFQQQPQQHYGFPSPYGHGLQNQSPYPHPQNYRPNYYHEQNSYRTGKNIDSEIEERIQNKPGINVIEAENDERLINDENKGPKWSFPNEGKTDKDRDIGPIKKPERPHSSRPVSKTLKFPDDRSDDRRQTVFPRKEKHIFFPKDSYYQIRPIFSYYQTTTPVNSEDYVFDHKHNFYVKRPKAVSNEDVVYVVRGNGDPNHPEVVKVRPGQRL